MAKPQKTEEQIIVSIHGKQIDLGDNFTDTVKTQLTQINSRYFSRLASAEVTISRRAGEIHARIKMHPAKKVTIHADATGFDALTAFNSAAVKAGDQLRGRKERISLRRKPAVTALKASGPHVNASDIADSVVLDFVEPPHSKAIEQIRLAAEHGIHDLGVQMRGRPGWKPEDPWAGAEIDPAVSPAVAPFRSDAEKAWRSEPAAAVANGPKG